MADQHEAGAERFSSASSHSMAGRSRWLVGSSSSSRSGEGARARARAARRCSPPERCARVLRAGQAELVEQGAGAVRVVAGPQPGLDIVERGREPGEVGLLRQIADGGAGLQEAACRASGCSSPAATFSRVDLPEPLRPTRQMRSPAPTPSSAPASSGALPRERRCLAGGEAAAASAGYGVRGRSSELSARLLRAYRRSPSPSTKPNRPSRIGPTMLWEAATRATSSFAGCRSTSPVPTVVMLPRL